MPNAPSVLDRLARAWAGFATQATNAEAAVPDSLFEQLDTDPALKAFDQMCDAGGRVNGLLEAAAFLGFSEEDVQRRAETLRMETDHGN